MDQISAEDVEQTSAPELLSGQIPMQAPPDRTESTGIGSILATVVPIIGSMGVVVFMTMSQRQNTWILFMAGAMVVAMLSIIALNIYRQVPGHHVRVNGLRHEYLAYLSEIRQTA